MANFLNLILPALLENISVSAVILAVTTVVLLLLLIVRMLRLENKTTRLILHFTKILFLGTVVLFVLGVVATLFLPSAFSCKEVTKQFEFDGCSVEYKEVIKADKCLPCSGLLPCISGFDRNLQIDILSCLCKAGKENSANTLAKTYYLFSGYESTSSICDNIPEKYFYL